jgi:hypothetical protein
MYCRYGFAFPRFSLWIALLSVLLPGFHEPLKAAQEPSRRIRVVKPRSPGNVEIKLPAQSKTANTESKVKGDKKAPENRSGSSEQPQGAGEELSQQKRQMARSIIDGALATAHQVSPVEYGILVQVEAASLLWEVDKETAHYVLLNAWERMLALLKDLTRKDSQPSRAEFARLKSTILRKVIRLKPELVRELSGLSSDGNSDETTVLGDWTEEAQAMVTVAEEKIESSPSSAASLLHNSLALGISGNLSGFLIKLGRRDKELAEREAMSLMSRLRNSSAPPLVFANLSAFVFSDVSGSTRLKEHYFDSFAARLRLSVRPFLPADDLEDSLNAARYAARRAAGLTRWETEFAQIISDLELLYKYRSSPVPRSPQTKKIDVFANTAGSDITRIREAVKRVESLMSPQARDKEYNKLAASAALLGEAQLAEDLLSKIEDEELRRITSVSVYGSLIRKALVNSEPDQAKAYAMRITDPLGRSLVVDWIARAMAKAGKTKQVIKEFYNSAVSQLQRELPTHNTARGMLILAKSLLTTDQESGTDAMRAMVSILNQGTSNRPFSKESSVPDELGNWMSMSSAMLKVSDVLDLSEMIGPAFQDLAKRDFNEAQNLALSLSHRGLSLLSQLATARVLLEEAGALKAPLSGEEKEMRN